MTCMCSWIWRVLKCLYLALQQYLVASILCCDGCCQFFLILSLLVTCTCTSFHSPSILQDFALYLSRYIITRSWGQDEALDKILGEWLLRPPGYARFSPDLSFLDFVQAESHHPSATSPRGHAPNGKRSSLRDVAFLDTARFLSTCVRPCTLWRTCIPCSGVWGSPRVKYLFSL